MTYIYPTSDSNAIIFAGEDAASGQTWAQEQIFAKSYVSEWSGLRIPQSFNYTWSFTPRAPEGCTMKLSIQRVAFAAINDPDRFGLTLVLTDTTTGESHTIYQGTSVDEVYNWNVLSSKIIQGLKPNHVYTLSWSSLVNDSTGCRANISLTTSWDSASVNGYAYNKEFQL